MKHTIGRDAQAIRIRIEELGERQRGVAAALEACCEGRCACPTPQYAKLASIEVQPAAGAIDVRLTPKPGETIDVEDLEKCLASTGQGADTR